MNRQYFVQILAEQTALRRMIESTPVDEVLNRGSLTARLEGIEHRIAEANVDEREPARDCITFNGRPGSP